MSRVLNLLHWRKLCYVDQTESPLWIPLWRSSSHAYVCVCLRYTIYTRPAYACLYYWWGRKVRQLYPSIRPSGLLAVELESRVEGIPLEVVSQSKSQIWSQVDLSPDANITFFCIRLSSNKMPKARQANTIVCIAKHTHSFAQIATKKCTFNIIWSNVIM